MTSNCGIRALIGFKLTSTIIELIARNGVEQPLKLLAGQECPNKQIPREVTSLAELLELSERLSGEQLVSNKQSFRLIKPIKYVLKSKNNY